jgi:tRNA threonylcarbamoyl adenosine modification protein (Sua5/YciO/YrdC/YwlC family)
MEKETQILNTMDTMAAARILRGGGLVALPTETVYGLAADCTNPDAVEGIFRAKGRPEHKPLSVLVSDLMMGAAVCGAIPPAAYLLASAFWPGPLTLVLPDGGKVAAGVTAGGKTIGLRCPDQAQTLTILRIVGKPLAAPSANLSGQDSPKSAEEVYAQMDGRIDAILDGGFCALGAESTILDLTTPEPTILRQGALPAERIWEVLREAEDAGAGDAP